MTNPRVRKIADRIQVIVAEMLERRIKDPRLGFVTITDVRVTGDSQQASIFYTVLGAEEEQTSTAAALESRQGRDPLGGRQAARHAHRADADVHPRRPAGERPRTSRSCWRAPSSRTRRSPRRRVEAYAGEADPYKKPRVAEDELDEDDDLDAEDVELDAGDDRA